MDDTRTIQEQRTSTVNGARPVVLVILVGMIGVYSPSFSNSGLFDERFLLSWAQASSVGELVRATTAWGGVSVLDFWGPLAAVLLKIDALLGAQSLLPRIISILLQAGSSILAFFVLKAIVQREGSVSRQPAPFHTNWFAPAAALLFAFSPLHLESVAWIGGQPQLLSGFFTMLALFFYVRMRGSSTAPGTLESGRRSNVNWRLLAAGGVSYLMALLASAYAWIAAIFVLMYEVWSYSSSKNVSKDPTQNLIPPLVFCVLAMMVLAAAGAGFKLLLTTPEINFDSAYRLLEVTFLPARPSLFPFLIPFFALSFWGAYRNIEYRHLLVFAFCTFIALWIPASGYAFNAQELAGTRFLFLAALPFSLLIVLLFASVQYVSSQLPLLKFLSPLFVIGVIAAYALADYSRLGSWADCSRIVELIGKSLSEDTTKFDSFLVIGIPDQTVRARAFRPGALALVDRGRNLIVASRFSSARLDQALMAGNYAYRIYQWHEPSEKLIPYRMLLLPGSVTKRSQNLPRLTYDMAKQSAQETEADKYLPPYYNFPDLPELGLHTLAKGADRIVLHFDVSNIGAAKGVLIEISEPNERFENPNGNKLSTHGYQTHQFRTVKGDVEISTGPLPGKGVYSIRAVAVDSEGAFIGKFSDAICILVR